MRMISIRSLTLPVPPYRSPVRESEGTRKTERVRPLISDSPVLFSARKTPKNVQIEEFRTKTLPFCHFACSFHLSFADSRTYALPPPSLILSSFLPPEWSLPSALSSFWGKFVAPSPPFTHYLACSDRWESMGKGESGALSLYPMISRRLEWARECAKTRDGDGNFEICSAMVKTINIGGVEDHLPDEHAQV